MLLGANFYYHNSCLPWLPIHFWRAITTTHLTHRASNISTKAVSVIQPVASVNTFLTTNAFLGKKLAVIITATATATHKIMYEKKKKRKCRSAVPREFRQP